MSATKKLFGRSRSNHRRRNVRRLGSFQSLEDRRIERRMNVLAARSQRLV